MVRLISLSAIILLAVFCAGCQKAEKSPDMNQPLEGAVAATPPDEPTLYAAGSEQSGAVKSAPSGAPVPKTQSDLLPVVISVKDRAEMVLIPGGPFVYGIQKRVRDSIIDALSTAHQRIFELEFDKKTVNLPAYYIDKYEVTNAQYAAFMKETGHRRPRYWTSRLYNGPKQPVVGVGWADAEAYAAWAGKRLPSEEEWEKAARGTEGRIWPWGNKPSSDKYNGGAQGNYAPVEVGSFPKGASPYGVMDMAGNVYEMTTGRWGQSGHAMRGGSYLNAGAYTRTMFRWSPANDTTGASWLGFRCVMDTSVAATLAKPPGRED